MYSNSVIAECAGMRFRPNIRLAANILVEYNFREDYLVYYILSSFPTPKFSAFVQGLPVVTHKIPEYVANTKTYYLNT